jgi:hypothetical protein
VGGRGPAGTLNFTDTFRFQGSVSETDGKSAPIIYLLNLSLGFVTDTGDLGRKPPTDSFFNPQGPFLAQEPISKREGTIFHPGDTISDPGTPNTSEIRLYAGPGRDGSRNIVFCGKVHPQRLLHTSPWVPVHIYFGTVAQMPFNLLKFKIHACNFLCFPNVSRDLRGFVLISLELQRLARIDKGSQTYFLIFGH